MGVPGPCGGELGLCRAEQGMGGGTYLSRRRGGLWAGGRSQGLGARLAWGGEGP